VKRLTLVCSIVLLLSGCLAKKKAAEAIDAAGPDPVADAVDADPGAPAAADADVAPLAPLAAVKPHPAAVKPKKPAANPDAPNCANARLYCNHPQVATNPKIKEQCTAFTADCLQAGGKL
jgi:hypothetical protein